MSQDEQKNLQQNLQQFKNESEVAQPPKYIDLISKSGEQKNIEQLDLFKEESEMNIQNSILATKKQMAQVRRELEDMKSQKPLNPEATIKKSQELKALQNGLQALEDLKSELF